MHLQQYQRKENGVGSVYDTDVIIYDANGAAIGAVLKTPLETATTALSVDSVLPMIMVLKAPGPDSADIIFGYGGDGRLNSDKSRCSMGGYDCGSRHGNYEFTCK